jgi:hypothetical protein
MPVSVYQTDDGPLHPIRMSAAKLALAGAVPSGGTYPPFVKISKSTREFGIRPRYALATTPNGATVGPTVAYERFICLTDTGFGTAPFAVGSTFTYKSKTYTVVKLVPEDDD